MMLDMFSCLTGCFESSSSSDYSTPSTPKVTFQKIKQKGKFIIGKNSHSYVYIQSTIRYVPSTAFCTFTDFSAREDVFCLNISHLYCV